VVLSNGALTYPTQTKKQLNSLADYENVAFCTETKEGQNTR